MAREGLLDLFGQYVDPSADSLLAKFDFGGLIRDTGRAAFLAVWAGIIGIVLAISEAFNALVDALGLTIRLPVEGVLTALTNLQATAVGIAAEDLEQFEIVALPASAAIAVAAAVVFAIGVAFLWGEAS